MDTTPEQPNIRIALIGDYDPKVTAHQAIPVALDMAADHTGLKVQGQWLATDSINADTPLGLRAIELSGHPFFVATLFQPERAALKGILPPLVRALVEACAGQQQ